MSRAGARSVEIQSLFAADAEVTLWWSTVVECASALERRRRDQNDPLPAPIYTAGCQRLLELVSEADEVVPTDEVRQQARHYLRTYTLRAADALQLAAARQSGLAEFVTLDDRLREAANVEGFTVIP